MLGDPHLSLSSLEFHARTGGQPHSSRSLARALVRCVYASIHCPTGAARQLLGPALQGMLAAMQWPGERELDSHEYQAFAAWKEMLGELAQLDVVGAPVSLRDACRS
jgi:hypothetical protein